MVDPADDDGLSWVKRRIGYRHGMTMDLFDEPPAHGREALGDGAWLLRGAALAQADGLLADVARIAAAAPPRRWRTPGGREMSVAMTHCGLLGWVSDRRGYRYEPLDPLDGRPWPPMPPAWRSLAGEAAREAGFPGFVPDACLINRYAPGDRLSLHQDRDEADPVHPIVSVSLGLPAVFLWGGAARTDAVRRIRLVHGDVVAWGGRSRLAYHGVAPLAAGDHPLTGACRWNLTFRRAG